MIIINCGFARTFTSLLFWTAFTNAPKLKNSLPPILIVLPFNTPIVELSAPIAAVPPDVASPVKAPPVGNPPVIILLLLVAPAAFQLIPKSKLFEYHFGNIEHFIAPHLDTKSGLSFPRASYDISTDAQRTIYLYHSPFVCLSSYPYTRFLYDPADQTESSVFWSKL